MSSPLSTLYRTAFVTGASAGLGKAFSEMLLAEGVRVWGTAREVSRLKSLCSLSNAFSAVALDLGNAQETEAVFARASQEAGGAFDVVINNAGYGVFGWFAETEYAQWQGQIDAMLSNTALVCHLAMRQMSARQRGCLVNITSLAVEFPLPFMSGYNIVKAGLSALSESLIFETRGTPVKVIDFRPGDYRTNFNHAMPPLPVLAAPTAADELRARSWRILDANLQAAPVPSRAANDLRRALRRRRSGTVRSGTIFQARVGPLISRCVPAWLRREILARYFGVS